MILKLNDISKIATRELKFYLNEDYTLLPTMSGLQGELYKVGLFKNKTVIRIRVERGRSKEKKYTSVCYISIEKFDFDVKNVHCLTTLWNGRGKELFYKEFYEIDRDVYTDSFDDYVLIDDKKQKRLRNSITNMNVVQIPINKNLLAIINSKKGYKTIKPKDIGRFYSYVNSYGKYFRVEFLDNKKQDLIIELY